MSKFKVTYEVVAMWRFTLTSNALSLHIAVLLQAMKEEPPTSAKCKDKFLIQSTIITASKESMSLHDLVRASSSFHSKITILIINSGVT